MSMAAQIPANSLIGNDVFIQGEIFSEEPLTIRGDVEGTIHMPRHVLTILSTGRVRADIVAREIAVDGLFAGETDASERICIGSTAEFIGDIRAARILVAEGAFLQGSVEILIQKAASIHPPQIEPQVS